MFEAPGDVLVFLTGEEEIEDACCKINSEIKKISNQCDIGPMKVMPLYSTLPSDMQQKVFDQILEKKIVVITNIVETSLTIVGVVYVVDPGFAKQKVYNPRTCVESLLVSPISKVSARYRSGWAGRTQPGKCFRLYTQQSFHNDLVQETYREILRSNLANTILTMKKLGVEDLCHYDFMDPPAPKTMMDVLQVLYFLGALDEDGNLTKVGETMSEFTLDPQMLKMLIVSHHYNCSNEILSIFAMLFVPTPFILPMDEVQEADEAKVTFAHIDGITSLCSMCMMHTSNTTTIPLGDRTTISVTRH